MSWLKFPSDWPVVVAAPWSFSLALLAAVCILGPSIWAIVSYVKSEQLANRDSIIALKNDQIKTLEHKIVELREKGTQPSRSPEWKMFMTSANIFRAGPPVPELTGIMLYVSILNTGTPAIVAEWILSITPPNEPTSTLRVRAIAEGLKISDKVFARADSLLETVKNKQIGAHPEEGWLMFLTELDQRIVVERKTRFELTVRDVHGNEQRVSRLIEEF